jgi:hypothetical protein
MNYTEEQQTISEQASAVSSLEQVSSLDKGKKKKGVVGRRKDIIWSYFEEKGERNRGHCGAACMFCGWEQKVAQINDMKAHLALYCKKVSQEARNFYLDAVKNNVNSSANKRLKAIENQPKISKKFESMKIDQPKTIMANRAIIKFFTCCGIPFHIVENPFFIDLLRILCPGYFPPSRQTLSVSMLNTEMSYVICETNNALENETNLTLGSYY